MTSYAIVPAAGRSKRMGSPKLLLPWGHATIIEQVLAAWRSSRVDRILVVVHPDDRELAERCRGDRVTVVIPTVPPPEMKDSVAAALRHIESECLPSSDDCWLLAPADMPNLSSATIDRLLTQHARRSCHSERSEESPPPPEILRCAQNDTSEAPILVPVHGGRRGHPVLFPWPLAAEVFALSATQGVNQLRRRHAVLEVSCGADELGDDVDTVEDYRRLASPRQQAGTSADCGAENGQ